MRAIIQKRVFSFLMFLLLALLIPIQIFADGLEDEEVIPAAKDIPISSNGAILMEATTGQVLFEQQAHDKLPIGTLNKIMTVLLVAEAIDRGELALTDTITAGNNAFSAKGAVIWLSAGEKMSVDDLLKGVIIGNANDASIALAEALSGTQEAFVDQMNARAAEIGMSNTVFRNCAGYDTEDQYSTAYDVALMSRELIKHNFLYPYMTCWMDELRGGATSIVNTNILVKNYNGIIGIKAGYSEAARNCLAAAAKRDDSTYIAVVLGCEDKDARFSEAKSLMNSGFSNYQVASPTVPSEVLTPIPVTGGTAQKVGVRVENQVNIVIPNGTLNEITHEAVLPERLEAPVKEGQIIGEISFYRNDQLLYKSNLLATAPVDEMTLFKAFSILLKRMVRF